MPLLNISCNKEIKNEKMLLAKSSEFISSLLSKPENFVMVKLNHSLPMYFAGTDKYCCFIEIKSIGALDPSKMSQSISDFFSAEMEIPSERIFINFEDVDSHMWAWNSRTFG